MSISLLDGLLFGLLGLLVGSFLNVVIYRLPRMLEAQWAADCAEIQKNETLVPQQKFNLIVPRSRCPHCGHAIAWYENIPVLSFVCLRGRCSACDAHIGLRYPLIELFTCIVFSMCGSKWGLSIQAVAWCTFAAILICQFWIDFDTQYLPDDLNYPLLWLGMLAAATGLSTASPVSSIWGAALGYLLLWSVYQLHHFLTGKEGMGYGDFKLMAALGAWFGADYLLALILVSSFVGAILGAIAIVIGRVAHRDIPIAFGPFIAGAGITCLLVGPNEVRSLVPFAFPFSR
jgi:leader peptidase (prepilin peptidase) / N-methyltransferase